MASVTQKREHAGHDHHHHDNVYLTSADKDDPAVRVTLLGLYTNIAIAIIKWVGGYYTHSHSLTADGWHSLGDTISDLITRVTLSFSRRLPNEDFPTGYGKVESIGALGVSGLLLYGGVEIGQGAIAELLQVYLPSVAELAEQWHVFGHIHSHGMNVVDPLAALIALGTVGVKAWVYFKTIRVANERRSSVLKSNAIHHLVDCWSGLAVFGAVGLGWLFPGVAAFDAMGGLVISLLVLKMGWSNFKMSLYELADIGVDEDVKAKVRRVADKAVADINLSSKETIELRQVQGVKSGQNYLMDLEIAAPSQWTLEQIRGVEDMVRERVGAKVRNARRVKVRFVTKASGQPDLMDEFIDRSVSPVSSPEPELEHDHSHDHSHDHDHSHSHDHNSHANGGLHKRR